ncbi:hypothetical protein BDV25DRAFT_146297 [Aspergillus avenaceus]|uniref:Uncharacterized protein n=1 Tax=Aspergillus avenaceus TaxID=36643 RepID=A0A5N6TCH0_ASPAV|nr:hypothetical protein BDV25DRAFT_146297 [Aspergillus avenaceus]
MTVRMLLIFGRTKPKKGVHPKSAPTWYPHPSTARETGKATLWSRESAEA